MRLIDRDISQYEKLFEKFQNNKSKKYPQQELQIMQLRQEGKQKQIELQSIYKEIDQLKKKMKVVRYQEIENDKRKHFEETLKLRGLIDQTIEQINQNQEKINITSDLKDQLNQLQNHVENNQKTIQELYEFKKEKEATKSQLSHLYKIGSEKYKTLENHFITLQNKNKRLAIDNIKLQRQIENKKQPTEPSDIKEQQKSFRIVSKSQKSQPKKQNKQAKAVKQSQQLDETMKIYQTELQYKLIMRGITFLQMKEMLKGLLVQAQEINQILTKDNLKNILTQEPFSYSDLIRIDRMIDQFQSEQGQELVNEFQDFLDNYKTFHDYEGFDLQNAEQKIQNDIETQQEDIIRYWQSNADQDRGENYAKILKFIKDLKFDWNEPQILFYMLNVFDKNQEKLQFIEINHILNPFYQEEVENGEIQQDQEEIEKEQKLSDEEDLFDKQSQEYTLDENGVRINNDEDEGNQQQQLDLEDEKEYNDEQNEEQEQEQDQDYEYNEEYNEEQQYEEEQKDNEDQEQIDQQEEQEYEEFEVEDDHKENFEENKVVQEMDDQEIVDDDNNF